LDVGCYGEAIACQNFSAKELAGELDELDTDEWPADIIGEASKRMVPQEVISGNWRTGSMPSFVEPVALMTKNSVRGTYG